MLTRSEPVLPSRPWYRTGVIFLLLAAAVLALYAALPKTNPVVATLAGGGCDHTPDASGVSACPHGLDANGGCNMNAAGAPSPAPYRAGKALEWVLPEGWAAEKEEGRMRFATLKPAPSGKVEVSVVVLSGPAGGELANVNRWRGQIGLSPIGEPELSRLRLLVRAKAGRVSLFDLDNPKAPEGRMVVGMLGSDSDSWFVKMTGDRASVSKARPAFLKLLESLRSNEAPFR